MLAVAADAKSDLVGVRRGADRQQVMAAKRGASTRGGIGFWRLLRQAASWAMSKAASSGGVRSR
jgi:hypothetical protein